VTFVIDRERRVPKKFVGATDTSLIEQKMQRLL